ncbi:MAG: DNA mismatch repair endonuclease MutL [Rhodospirillaceae bacterium]|nr:DNA mismatch repair endonuclease MutL [Rhodospirillaceae bacterium]MYB12027.1 DNA mismatch repair endonuclease MutL [Rhodospirillaceae bacterium]MYI49350.1 DNA mismatch repair endonuclease MutL [Rhodospirillaceae bacterium]
MIRLLPPDVVNRIAAGEVIERPAAVVKELVENAIDAGARKIDAVVRNGGRSYIAVTDDGCGMGRKALSLAVERHATSKLPDDDLVNISTLGFRGEALPSIGAVSRLKITTRGAASDTGWTIHIQGGLRGIPGPAPMPDGTKVEVFDLFYATPARLKFLKSERSEQQAVCDTVNRLAMAHPEIGFTLRGDGERPLVALPVNTGDMFDIRLARLSAILGKDFADNAVRVDAVRDTMRLTGHIGVPTLHRGTARHQFLFVNGRPVKDRLMTGTVRGAYRDFLARDRHPVVALFLDISPDEVDVNVHPAKAEVRFRDSGAVRGMIVSALRHALAEAGHRASTTVADAALGAFRPSNGSAAPSPAPDYPANGTPIDGHGPAFGSMAEAATAWQGPNPPHRPASGTFDGMTAPSARPGEFPEPDESAFDNPLGAARAQVHRTYIVSQTADGIVIVDQHAAHERLVYEEMKAALANGGVHRQGLLIPEVVELEDEAANALIARRGDLAEFGLAIEKFGGGAIVVREYPALLGDGDIQGLVRDLADEIVEMGGDFSLKEKLDEVCGTIACHSSIRAGRSMNGDEMNALLRQMEATPHSGQCNHGRPTYVELKLDDLERLFGRR